MQYFVAIKTALFIFPVIALLFTIPFILRQYHIYGSIHKVRVLIIYSFILYLLIIYFLVILPLPKIEDVVYRSNMIRLIPFGFISDFFRETSFVFTNPKTYIKAITEPCFYTVVFNIFMTIPFGMYLRYYFKCNLKKTVLFSFFLSLFFELTQLTGLYFLYPYPYRIFDVDDLIMNTLGGILGYFIVGGIRFLLPSRDKIDQDSYEAGRVVSGFRRITMFVLDFTLYLFLTLFLSLFIQNGYVKYLSFAIYYIVLSSLLKGDTLGGKFLKIHLHFSDYSFIRNILRSVFLYVYYFFIPFGLFLVSFFVIRSFQDVLLKFVCIFNLFLVILFFYLLHILLLLTKKKMYYDDLFKVNFISMIGR